MAKTKRGPVARKFGSEPGEGRQGSRGSCLKTITRLRPAIVELWDALFRGEEVLAESNLDQLAVVADEVGRDLPDLTYIQRINISLLRDAIISQHLLPVLHRACDILNNLVEGVPWSDHIHLLSRGLVLLSFIPARSFSILLKALALKLLTIVLAAVYVNRIATLMQFKLMAARQ